MARELQADFITGRTVYFLLRNSVGQIWNGATFEVFQNANYATYPITGTEQAGSGYYTGDMPAISTPDIYAVVAKDQTGGSPAQSDLSASNGDLFWTGTAVGISVTSITTTALASIFRRDMANDQASAAIQSLCSMILKLTSAFDAKLGITYRTDGTTPHMTQAVTTDVSMVPIRKLGVGA